MAKEIQARGFDYSAFTKQFVSAAKTRAERIRDLAQQAGKNVIAAGALLKQQRDAFGDFIGKSQARGADTWDAWCRSECEFGRKYAHTLIQISEKFGVLDKTTPPLGQEIMKMLATKNTPPSLVEKVVALAKRGKCPTHDEVARMKKAAVADPRPTPTEAKEKAKATGQVVIASDNRIYTPMPEDEVEAFEERRDRTYNTIDAINLIGSIPVEPKEWIEQAEQHWLMNFNLGQAEAAVKWINLLIHEYKRHSKVIDNGHEKGKAARHARA